MYHSLRENRLSRPAPPVAPPSLIRPQAAAAVPEPERITTGRLRSLVGRAKEWSVLLHWYARAAGGCCVALEGEAGIGKTRLAEEFLTYAQGRGAGVAAGRCYEGESGVSYGIVAQVLRELLQQAQCQERLTALGPGVRAEVARLLPELAIPGIQPVPEMAADPGAGVRFLESLCEFLTALCPREAATALFFDDLHWADAASLDFLAYLVHRLAARPVFLLLVLADGWLTRG